MAGKKTRELRIRTAENTHLQHPTRQITLLVIEIEVDFEPRGHNLTRKPSQKSRSLFSNYHYQRGRRAATFAHVGTQEGENVELTAQGEICGGFFDDPIGGIGYFPQKSGFEGAYLETLFGREKKEGEEDSNKEVRLGR